MLKKEIEKLDEEWIKETGCEESEDFVIAAFKGETPEVIKRLHLRDAKLLELVQVEIRKKYVSSLGFGMLSRDEALDKAISVIDEIKEDMK